MKLTTRSEYTLLALVYFARHREKSWVKAADICATYGIPKKYLETLLSSLKQGGFIRARRGAEGGYQLAREPKSISAAEVIRLMDGALAPTESVSVYFYAATPLEKEKKVIAMLRRIRNDTARVLEGTSLADLV